MAKTRKKKTTARKATVKRSGNRLTITVSVPAKKTRKKKASRKKRR